MLAARNRDVVKKNMAILPAYLLMLGFLALLGFMALADHLKPVGGTKGHPDTNTIVPWLSNMFPQWSPASRSARSRSEPWCLPPLRQSPRRTRSPGTSTALPPPGQRQGGGIRQQTGVDHHQVRRAGLLIGLNLSFALEFQLIGGVVIIQIVPALVLRLYTRWYHRWSLVAGWIVGMGLSVYMLYVTPSKTAARFGSASFMFKTWGFDTKMTIWTGIVGLIANLIAAKAPNPLFRRLPHGNDETTPADYEIEGPAEPIAVAAEQAHRAT